MAILKIARMGHPVLAHAARPVEDPGAEPVRRLIGDMIETMLDAEGIGLAAPRPGVRRAGRV
jgi:peptide deformylase